MSTQPVSPARPRDGQSGALQVPLLDEQEPFDRLVRLASEALTVPISLITLRDGDHSVLKSSIGLPEHWSVSHDSPLLRSLTEQVNRTRRPVSVADVRAHDLTGGAEVLDEVHAVAFAAAPLLDRQSRVLGALAVLDSVPHEWTERERRILDDIAAMAGREMQHRAISEAPKRSRSESDPLEDLGTLVESSLAGVFIVRDGRFLFVNQKLARMFGYEPQDLVSSRSPSDLVVREQRHEVTELLQQSLRRDSAGIHHSFTGVRRNGVTLQAELLVSRTVIGGQASVIGLVLDVTDRKRHEDELRKRDAHSRFLLSHTWDAIHEVDVDGAIRFVSRTAQETLGYSYEKLIGRPVLELVHPDDTAEMSRHFADSLENPETGHLFRTRMRRSDGMWLEMAMQMKMVRGADDTPVVIINTRDVTETEEVQRALRESEERYRLVARATNSAIREWDVATGRCTWTGSSNLLLRYTAEEIGSTIDWWYERIQAEHRENVVNSLQAALDGAGEAWSDEYGFLRGDGHFATVLDCCHITRNERGMPMRVVGSLVDVTERRRSEEAQRFLARASTLLGEDLNLDTTLTSLARLAVPTLADYCLIDLVEQQDGKDTLRRVALAHVDPTQEYRLRKDENHPLDGDPERHPVIRVVRSQEPVLVTECSKGLLRTISHDEDHYRKLVEMGLRSFMIVPLVAHGTSLGVITMAMAKSSRRLGPQDLLLAENLAHRAALVIEHAKLFAEAQNAIHAREDVLGIVSHDLRNPLNIIHLSSALMLESMANADPKNVQSLNRIMRASGQMAEMIEELLDVYTIDGGRFSITRSPQRVSHLVQEVCEQLKPLADQQQVSLERVVADGLPDIDIDAGQILRVFSNLVGNAIKFTPRGGTITLTASPEGGGILFTVADTGPGIPPGLLAHVFDRYWQADSSDRRGIGLGLAIAKGIVEAHGGTIWAKSGENGGAVFCFSIPAPVREAVR